MYETMPDKATISLLETASSTEITFGSLNCHFTLHTFPPPTQMLTLAQGAEKSKKGPFAPQRDLPIHTVLSVNSSLAASSQLKMGLNQRPKKPEFPVARWVSMQNSKQNSNSSLQVWYNEANHCLWPEFPESHSPSLPTELGSSGTAQMLQGVIDSLCQKQAKSVSVSQGISNLFSASFTFNSRKIHWSNSKLEEVVKGQMRMYHTSNFFSESQCIRGFLLSSKSDSKDWIYANYKVKIIRDRSKV